MKKNYITPEIRVHHVNICACVCTSARVIEIIDDEADEQESLVRENVNQSLWDMEW